MESLIYLLKVTACTVLFFGFYLVFLRKLTFFKINRFYLLVTLVLSFIIPTLKFEIKREIVAADTAVFSEVPEIKPINPAPVKLIQPVIVEYDPQVTHRIDWLAMVSYVYVGVASFLLLICLWRVISLLKHTGNSTKNDDGLKMVQKSEGFTNCSFFNYVFIDKNALTNTDLAVLLKHEQVHARQYHSADKIMLMVIKSVLWFNPIVYLYDKALEQVHEYEADEITSNAFGNQAYAQLLLKLAISKNDMPLVHNFVKSPIKYRIKMLFHSKSKNRRKLAYLLVLPVAFGLFWLFAVQVVYANKISSGEPTIENSLNVTSKMSDDFNGITALPNHKQVKVVPFQTKEIILPNDLSREKILLDTVKPTRPKIISFSKIRGDVNNKISYLENGVMEVFNYRLEAENIIFDQANNKIIAKTGILKSLDGKHVIKASEINFDAKTGIYNVVSVDGKLNFSNKSDPSLEKLRDSLEVAANRLQSDINYSAKDSVKLNKDKSIISLFGNAKVLHKDISLTGAKIIYNKNTNTVFVYGATMISGNNKVVKADSLIFDIKTKKAKLYGTD